MLERKLTERVAGCFYSDADIASILWEVLTKNCALNTFGSEDLKRLQDDCYHLLVKNVDAQNSCKYRLTDIRQLTNMFCNENLFLSPDLPSLVHLSQKLLRRDGNLLCFREKTVQSYVRLASEVDPTLLGGLYFCNWIQNEKNFSRDDFCHVISAQTAFLEPQPDPEIRYADGHVHLWGVTPDSVILEQYLFGRHSIDQVSQRERQQYEKLAGLLERARSLSALLFDSIQTEDENDWLTKLQRLRNPMLEKRTPLDWESLANTHESADVRSSNWILRELATAMEKGSVNRWLWLQFYLCFRYQSANAHPEERIAILCFWQTVNALRKTLIMDGQGLTRFTELYYSNALGRGAGSHKEVVRRLFAGSEDLAEIKVGSNSFGSSLAKQISSAVSNLSNQNCPSPPYIFGEHEISPSSATESYLQLLERWHFCAHFSRTSSRNIRENRATPNCKEIWRNGEKLHDKFYRQSGWSDPVFIGGRNNTNYNFRPFRWLRGLDVAGDENALKIEWFAPALRWLRSHKSPEWIEENSDTRFHLSIHAGEDYAHPASGMRHIDETVVFCKMRSGDRLGHALALGITPSNWAGRQREMILPLDEHLDNLVWLWSYADVLRDNLSEARRVLPSLEKRIHKFHKINECLCLPILGSEFDDDTCSPELPDETDSSKIDINLLHEAWKLRRNCNYQFQQLHDTTPITDREILAIPDWAILSDKNHVPSELYFNRHRRLAAGTKFPLVIIRVEERHDDCDLGASSHFPGIDNHILDDFESEDDLKFMHALQDHLLEKYASMGLIIEANPTSNIYIARLERYSEHPIFRWCPPNKDDLKPGGKANLYSLRHQPMSVLVNTDDPGIMPTTLRTEFLLLREATNDHGVDSTVTDEWLESLRCFGVEQFKNNHLKIFEQT